MEFIIDPSSSNTSLPLVEDTILSTQESEDGASQSSDAFADNESETVPDSQPNYLEANRTNRVFLMTYSRADLNKFPTRQSFGAACVAGFGAQNTLFFSVGQERHRDGAIHYHAAIRLKNPARWFKVKKYVMENHQAVVHFSSSPGGMYGGAYSYATKTDVSPFIGSVLEPHPTDEDIQKDMRSQAALANQAYRKKKRSAAAAAVPTSPGSSRSGQKKAAKAKRVDRLDVTDFIRRKDIKDDDQLMAAAEIARQSGDRDLPKFILNLGEKGRKELLRDAWKLHNAISNVELASKSRLDLLTAYHQNRDNCKCPKDLPWLALAIDVLSRSDIDFVEFGKAVYELLQGGRKKFKNIILTGESNCGKTFLLKPLQEIYTKTFNTPPASQFGWLGVEDAQIIFLNDFRWVPLKHKGGVISWDALLRLLEGAECKLPAPMNTNAAHILLPPQKDIPIFCTSRSEIKFFDEHEKEPQTQLHKTENAMMNKRWNVFKLTHVFEEDKCADREACGWCFAALVLHSQKQ